MKKLLSILCALSIMVSLSSTAYAERTEPDHDPVPEPNTIFGTDERQVVTNTSQKGANAVCNLTLTFKKGNTYYTKYGTGFMYSRLNMATAGHCIWDPSLDTYVETIKIAPGDTPSGGIVAPKTVTYKSGNLHVPSQYVNNGDEDWRYDYGVVVLTQQFPSPVGYFGLDSTFTDKQYETEYLNLSGYDSKSRNQYKQRSNSKMVEVRNLDFLMKYDTQPGMSGSPIYTDDRYVVGLYNYAASSALKVGEDYTDGYNSAHKLGNDGSSTKSKFYQYLKQYYIDPE